RWGSRIRCVATGGCCRRDGKPGGPRAPRGDAIARARGLPGLALVVLVLAVAVTVVIVVMAVAVVVVRAADLPDHPGVRDHHQRGVERILELRVGIGLTEVADGAVVDEV